MEAPQWQGKASNQIAEANLAIACRIFRQTSHPCKRGRRWLATDELNGIPFHCMSFSDVIGKLHVAPGSLTSIARRPEAKIDVWR